MNYSGKEKLMNQVHEAVDRVGLSPWWTVATNGWRGSSVLSTQLPQATTAHRGGGKRGRSQWGSHCEWHGVAERLSWAGDEETRQRGEELNSATHRARRGENEGRVSGGDHRRGCGSLL
jgi:hypothetical protein